MKKAVNDHNAYVDKLKVAASKYSERIVLLRKDIVKLSQTYRHQQESVSSQSLSPHKALDRVPKMDRLKESYRRLQILADYLEAKSLPDKIFEYENFPARYILEGTSSINHNIQVSSNTKDYHDNSMTFNEISRQPEDKRIDTGRTKKISSIVDLNRLMDNSIDTLNKSVAYRNKNITMSKEFISLEQTLRQMASKRRERTESLKQVHNKLLDYISKVPYS